MGISLSKLLAQIFKAIIFTQYDFEPILSQLVHKLFSQSSSRVR